jgi:hypothetical protein
MFTSVYRSSVHYDGGCGGEEEGRGSFRTTGWEASRSVYYTADYTLSFLGGIEEEDAFRE